MSVNRAVAIVVLLFLASRCGGDPGYEMRIQNASDQTLTVYELGASASGERGFMLAAGETKITHWLHPRNEDDTQETTVKAVSASGTVVYCQRFSYATAKGDFEWRVRITAGHVEC
jgi:hypothetical protein